MRFPRRSGLLLHPTSFPSRYGIGELSQSAYDFVDYLQSAGQTLWQILPLGPTGFGDSPYQCFSAFAGNPLLISIDDLVNRDLLSKNDLGDIPEFPVNQTDYGWVYDWKYPILRKAYETFKNDHLNELIGDYHLFCREEGWWLDDFATFMAIKQAHEGVVWTEWEPSIAHRKPEALQEWRERLHDEIEMRKFWQFIFFKQWWALKTYCWEKGIQVIGDIPIYVAHDSSDVWAQPQLYHLKEDGNPIVVAGVPPDYFSETGQLWGNPIYHWERLREQNFQWWVARVKHTLSQVDIVRIDHFRGFQAYWEVPADEETAINGRWVDGPKEGLFHALRQQLGELPIIAENLGLITEDVEALREQFNLPGMAVMQFAFGGDSDNPYLPHNYPQNIVAYSGTHDNDTTLGWWGGGEGSTRTKEQILKEQSHTKRYLNCSGMDIHWTIIRSLMISAADTVIFPVQDILGLGAQARMNQPGSSVGNWQWRYKEGDLTGKVSKRLHDLTELYGRAPKLKT